MIHALSDLNDIHYPRFYLLYSVNMFNNAKKLVKNVGLKALRKKAGWGNETFAFILNQNF